MLAAFTVYSALAVLLTFPLVLHLSSRLPKDLGDPLLVTSILWWNAQVIPLTEQWWNGFGFFPAAGMMAFSEHFLGASLFASPLQWIGLSPVAAYNLTFLLSFPLCGIAAHALALAITNRHDAGVVCGLCYAFNPYRVAHVEHLELLMAFGMPAALAALHCYAAGRGGRWLAVFAAALVVQALSCSYYALFFSVLFGLWLLWFMPPRHWRRTLAAIAAAGAAALVLSPIVAGYARIHRAYGLSRDFTGEILNSSGDISSLVTASSLSALWGWTAVLNGAERQLFPGLTIAVLAGIGAVSLRQLRAGPGERGTAVPIAFWVLAVGFGALAAGAWLIGPWRVDWGWLRISVTAPYKPLSLAGAFGVLALAVSPTMRAAFRERSALAFYLVAAFVLFLCSLGPQPTFLGERVLYEPPYAWLMRLPLFGDTIRVPARFAMLGILALSVAGGLAVVRLRLRPRYRTAILLLVSAGVLADGWIRRLPLPSAPQHVFGIPQDSPAPAVLELPLGDVWSDTAALYRATQHRRPVVNGYNGFEPPYYQALRRALADRDPTVFDTLAAFGPLLIALDKETEPEEQWSSFLLASGLAPSGVDRHWTLFKLPVKRRDHGVQEPCAGKPLAVAAVFDARRPIDTTALTDRDPATWWMTAQPQRAGDVLTVDVGDIHVVCTLVLSMGHGAVLYPGKIRVATSPDNLIWQTVFVGRIGGLAVQAALDSSADARIAIPLEGRSARFIAVRVEEAHPTYPWAVAGLAVEGGP